MSERGLPADRIGLVLAAQGALVLLLELPTGGLADATGRRLVLIAASLVRFAALAVFLLAQSPWLFAASYALRGVFHALDSGPLQSWYVDAVRSVSAEADIDHGLARSEVLAGVAIAAGSGLAAFSSFIASSAISADGLLTPASVPVLLASASVAVQGLATVALVREVSRPTGWSALRRSASEVPVVLRSAINLARNEGGIRTLVLVAFGWGFGQIAMEVLWQPRLADLLDDPNTAASIAGVVSIGMWLAASMGSATSTRLRDALGTRQRAAVVAKLVQGGAIMAMALANTPVLLGLAIALSLVGNGAASPLHDSMLHRRAESSERTTVLSINSMAGQTGGMLGNIAMGALASSVGIPFTWIAAGLILIAVAPAYLTLPPQTATSRGETGPGA